MSNEFVSSRCAACKYLRRRCLDDCVLAPYFPPTHPERFDCVHKIFGAGNISRMLQQLPVHRRAEAADAISYEAYCRIQDPIYGCVGLISHLQEQISKSTLELSVARAEIAMVSTQLQLATAESMEENYPREIFYSDQFFLDQYQLPD